MGKFIQGFFRPKNKEKYEGDVSNCIYRSSWELKYMMELDNDPRVEKWSSESVVIGYQDGMGKRRRYFVDFKVVYKTDKEGVFHTELIEIKPAKETLPPVISKTRNKKRMIQEVLTFDKNQSKWAAARAYCAKKGWEFKVLDEYSLGIKKK